MRYYIPPGVLDRREKEVLRRMSPRSISVIVAELDEPGSQATVHEILRARDPEAALAKQIVRETRAATLQAVRQLSHGLGDYGSDLEDAGLGGFKKFRKRLRKKITKALPKPLQKIKEKVSGAIKRVGRKYGNVIIGVAGAVLAPFTGGASLAAAAALSAANTMYQQKREAQRIAKVNEREAARINAEVAAEERKLAADLDKLYNENKPLFAAAGITDSAWAGLTLEQKLAVIEKINKGQMPAAPEAVQEQAEAQGVPVPPTTTAPNWMAAIQSASIYQQALAAAQQQPVAPPPAAPSPPAPTAGPPPSYPTEGPPAAEQPAPAAPAGNYELYVEGEKVFETEDSNAMFQKVGMVTKEGDRFEVFLNGKSLGLKIRVAGGVISVPADQEARVRTMSHGEVRSMVARATNVAKGEGERPGEGAGVPWWLILGGAAAVAAAAA